jgi:hypothetical protein
MEDPDLSVRKHTAANDPAFPARREEAYTRMVEALNQALVPLGYLQKGSTWSRMSPLGKSAVHLQRSRYGWDAQIVLRFIGPDGAPPADWDGETEMTLEQLDTSDAGCGTLAFLDVLESPTLLSQAIETLVTAGLPWLDRYHQSET